MAKSRNLIFVGISGTVLALDKSTGTEAWRTELPGSFFVNVAVEGNSIYASTRGEIFCLDPASGAIRWNNPLKGLGRGLVSIGLPGGQSAAMAEKILQDEQAAAAGAAVVVTS